MRYSALAVPLALLSLAACGPKAPERSALDRLDDELANGSDPVAATALNGPLMTDPTLAQSADADAVRPPPRPATLGSPERGRATPMPVKGAVTLGEVARRERDPATAACADRLAYSATWANRLPADLPLYPDARVAEAAGNDGCGLRVVSFASGTAPAAVAGWYRSRAARAGYAAEQRLDGRTEVLGGTLGEKAFMLYAAPRPDGGSDVDLVVNHGR